MTKPGVCFLFLGLMAISLRTSGAEEAKPPAVDRGCPGACTRSPESTASSHPVVLAFEASWCRPCQRMAPILAKLKKEGFVVRRVDIDRDRATARRYSIQSIPTFVSIVGGQEKQRIVGLTTEARIRHLVFSTPKARRLRDEPGESCIAAPDIPAASQAVPLIRATYPIGKEKAKALLTFLESHSDAKLEIELREEAVEITTTPEKQMGIGRFIQMFLSGDEVKTASADTLASTCDAATEPQSDVAKNGE